MERSESIREIAIALSKFQGEFKKSVPFCEVINTTKETLTKYGLSIIQYPYTEGENIAVETILLHESGEWIKSKPLSLKMDNMSCYRQVFLEKFWQIFFPNFI